MAEEQEFHILDITVIVLHQPLNTESKKWCVLHQHDDLKMTVADSPIKSSFKLFRMNL